MQDFITVSAHAKLNLALHGTGRRADGYHLLETLVVFTELADMLIFSAADTLSLQMDGIFAEAAGDGADNLVLRAARALQQASKCRGGARITLHKNIPVGAGLGGGSADAAATLRALNTLWNVSLSEPDLLRIAGTLGADVPMCLYGAPLIARGVGEVLSPLAAALPNMAVVLVYPNVKLTTADVFRTLPADAGGYENELELPADASFRTFAAWLAADTRNDLQSPAIACEPVIADVLRAMEMGRPSPALVRMTGSGSCCFALFAEYAQTESYALALAAQHPDWRVTATRIL